MGIDIKIPIGRTAPVALPGFVSSARVGITAIAAGIIAYNAVVVCCSGYLLALLYANLTGMAYAIDETSDFITATGRLSLIAAFLSPFFLNAKASPESGQNKTDLMCLGFCQLAILLGLVLAIGIVVGASPHLHPSWLAAWFVTLAILTVGGRSLLLYLLYSPRFHRIVSKRVAIVGAFAATEQIIRHLHELDYRSVDIVGVFHDDAEAPLNENLAALVELGKHYPLDCIILAIPAAEHGRLTRAVDRLKALNVEIVYYPGWIDQKFSEWSAEFVGELPVYKIVRRPINELGLVLKSVEDKALASILIVILAPLMLIIAAAIRFDSPGPILFRQKRNGINNTVFDIFKFRTMTHAREADHNFLVQTRRNDSRVTKVGRFLRSTSLDELPQLFNVLRGEMSLVGPRPHPIAMRTENRSGEEISADYAHRHRVKPGMTGWAQVNGLRGATDTVSEIARRVEYDIFYIDHWSLLFDLRILVMTPIKIIVDRDRAY
jgi:Undecaprenyl-phosphate glucose phosphotransferase